MEISPTAPLLVVAAAIINSSGEVLMHRRHRHSVHGGLWEFPGGKVEPGEGVISALIREITEELGISLASESLVNVGFASETQPTATGTREVVILLMATRTWLGVPQCLEGEEIGWVPGCEIAALAMPPLDYPLARQLNALLSAKLI